MPAAQHAIMLDNRQAMVPVLLGTGEAASGSSTLTITTSAAIPAGAQVFVVVQYVKSTAITISSISDATNSYSLLKTQAWDVNTFIAGDVWMKENAAAVASSATITVTFNTTTSNGESTAIAFYVNGTQRQTGLSDVSASTTTGASGTTSPSSGATASLAQTHSLIIGAGCWLGGIASNPNVSAENNSFITIANKIGTNQRLACHAAYKFQNNSNSAVTYAPTLNTSCQGDTIVVALRA